MYAIFCVSPAIARYWPRPRAVSWISTPPKLCHSPSDTAGSSTHVEEHALGGFLGDEAVRDPQIFSYEGPFGVGYLVAGFGLTEAV